MVIRSKGSFYFGDLSSDASQPDVTLGPVYEFGPEVFEYSKPYNFSDFILKLGQGCGAVVMNKQGDKLSTPGFTPYFDLYVASDYVGLIYKNSGPCQLFKVKDNPMILENFDAISPCGYFADDFSLMTQVLPYGYVALGDYNYTFYSNVAKENAAGLFGADRAAWKNRSLIYAENLPIASYGLNYVPMTVEGTRAAFFMSKKAAYERNKVTIRTSRSIKAKARAYSTMFRMGKQLTNEDVKDLRECILDYSDVKPTYDSANMGFLYKLLASKFISGSVIRHVYHTWAQRTKFVQAINDAEIGKPIPYAVAYDYDDPTYDKAYAELLEELQRIDEAATIGLRAIYSEWFDVMDQVSNKFVNRYSKAGAPITVDIILKKTYNDIADAFKSVQMSVPAELIPFPRFEEKVDPTKIEFSNGVMTIGNHDSIIRNNRFFSPVMNVDSGELEKQFRAAFERGETFDQVVKSCIPNISDIPDTILDKFISDTVTKNAEVAIQNLSDAVHMINNFDMAVQISAPFSCHGEESDGHSAISVIKKMEWCAHTYWEINDQIDITIPSAKFDEDGQTSILKLGTGFDQETGIIRDVLAKIPESGITDLPNLKFLPYDPAESTPQFKKPSVSFEALRLEDGVLKSTVKTKFDLWVNYVPIIHNAFGEARAIQTTKEVMAALSNQLSKYRMQARLVDLSKGTMPGVPTMESDYEGAGLPGHRSDWLMHLSRDKGPEGNMYGTNYRAAVEGSLTLNGDPVPACYTLTRYLHYEISFSFDANILDKKDIEKYLTTHVLFVKTTTEEDGSITREWEVRDADRYTGLEFVSGCKSALQAFADSAYALAYIKFFGKVKDSMLTWNPVGYYTRNGVIVSGVIASYLSSNTHTDPSEKTDSTAKFELLLEGLKYFYAHYSTSATDEYVDPNDHSKGYAMWTSSKVNTTISLPKSSAVKKAITDFMRSTSDQLGADGKPLMMSSIIDNLYRAIVEQAAQATSNPAFCVYEEDQIEEMPTKGATFSFALIGVYALCE